MGLLSKILGGEAVFGLRLALGDIKADFARLELASNGMNELLGPDCVYDPDDLECAETVDRLRVLCRTEQGLNSLSDRLERLLTSARDAAGWVETMLEAMPAQDAPRFEGAAFNAQVIRTALRTIDLAFQMSGARAGSSGVDRLKTLAADPTGLFGLGVQLSSLIEFSQRVHRDWAQRVG